MSIRIEPASKLNDSRINVEEEQELSYWCDKLAVSKDELRAAVERVGPQVSDVRLRLGIF